MMVYNTYKEVIADMEYANEISYDPDEEFDKKVKLTILWRKKIKQKYEDTKNSNTKLGKFLKMYPLSLKELRILVELIGDHDFYFGISSNQSIFEKYRLKYNRSNLRKHKLVFKIRNPKTPMSTDYVVSYRAQLALLGKKYTSEYEELDMAMEEESNRGLDGLDTLYYTIKPNVGFKDLIVDDKLKQDLFSAVARADNHDKIFKEWGLGRVIDYGRGTTLNFRGPPGTGKTMAANCLAKELDKLLLMVRYDQIQSMWVGETEKHIQRVFKLAKSKKAILFFDEADAIAHNRAGLEKSWEMSAVNTLLKELERFEGVCIFATNFSEKYDKAFERRLTMHIDFKLPTESQGALILDKILPNKARAKGLTLEGLNLAGLSGGDIKNVALNAAGIAAKEKTEKIERAHIKEAIIMANCKKGREKKDIGYIS